MKWTLYKSTKRFLTFPGLFSKQGAPAGWVTSRERAEERCLELGNDCVALETRRDSSVVTMLDYIDLDSFRPSPSVRTRIRAVRIDRQTRILATSAWDLSDIDFCCPENRRIEQDTVRQSLRDNIKRISCDIPAEEFEADYVRRQEPVILENCTSLWEAQHSWTFSSLLGLGGGKETWRTDFITNQEMMQLWGQKGEDPTPANCWPQTSFQSSSLERPWPTSSVTTAPSGSSRCSGGRRPRRGSDGGRSPGD